MLNKSDDVNRNMS